MIRFAFLSDTFFEDYPASRCPEIEQKRNRPYVVVFISVGERTFAIPMRSHIRHPHAFLTDKVNRCGVDYTKAVVITDEARYIDPVNQPHIRSNEFDALRGKDMLLALDGEDSPYLTRRCLLQNDDAPVGELVQKLFVLDKNNAVVAETEESAADAQ